MMAVDNFLPGAPLLPTWKGDDIAGYMLDLRKQQEQEKAEALKTMMFGQTQAARLEHDKSVERRQADTDARMRDREDRLDRENTARAEMQRRAEIGKQLPDITSNLENPDLVRARLGSLNLPYTESQTRGAPPQLGATPPPPLGPTQVEEGPQETPEIAEQAGLFRATQNAPGDTNPAVGAAEDARQVAAAQAERQRFAQANDPATVAANQAQVPAHQAMQQFFNQRTAAFPAEQQEYDARPEMTAFDVQMPGGQHANLDPYAIRASREASWGRTADKWAKDNTYMSPGDEAQMTNQYVHMLHGEIGNGLDPTAADKQLKEFIAADNKKAFLAAMLGQKQDFQWKNDRTKAGEAMHRTLVVAGARKDLHDADVPKQDEKLRNQTSAQFRMEEAGLSKRFGVNDIGNEINNINALTGAVKAGDSASAAQAVGLWVKTAQGKGDRISDADIKTFFGRIGGADKYFSDPMAAAEAAAKGELNPVQQRQMVEAGKRMLVDRVRNMKKYVKAGDTVLGDRYPEDWKRYRAGFEGAGLAPAKDDPEKERRRAIVKTTGNPSDAEDFQRLYGESP